MALPVNHLKDILASKGMSSKGSVLGGSLPFIKPKGEKS